jgi:hypothetical protein
MTTRTQAALRKLIADTTTAPTMRRAATLRLSRLRAATTALPTTTRATPPVATGKAIFEAVTSFRALARQRTALLRKRRTAGEREILATLIALMPAAVPQGDDAKPWSDFIERVDLMLEEIRNIKNL